MRPFRFLILPLALLTTACAPSIWNRGPTTGITCNKQKIGLDPLRAELPADHGRYAALRDPTGRFYLAETPTVSGGIAEFQQRTSTFPASRAVIVFPALQSGWSRSWPGERRRVFGENGDQLGRYTLLIGENFETDYATVVGRCSFRYAP